MKIVVAIKQVPERDAPVKVAGKWIDEDGLSYTINEPDAYALEEALQLKEKNGGEVVVVCAGPERVQSTLREALAKGADSVWLPATERVPPSLPRAVAVIWADWPAIWVVTFSPSSTSCATGSAKRASVNGLSR